MTGDSTSDATVLVVEDERHLADLYADYLGDEYGVVTAYTGEEGLERLTDDVDVALVDQRMPGLSGHEMLAAIESADVECRVAMVTSSQPDFDIIGPGVDDYLAKPVTRTELLTIVERLLAISEYTEALKRLTRKKLTRNVLRVEKSRQELSESERYHELHREITELQDTVDELAAELDLEERELVL